LSKRKREAILSHLSKPDAYQDQQPCRLKIATHYSFGLFAIIEAKR